jgi:predicted O-methyltransferase YrrM
VTRELWASVDDYLTEALLPADPALDQALRTSENAGLPAIAVSASHGKFLHLLARLQGARKILEVGTLGGYSTIWLARALPAGGRLVTLEIDPKHAEVARANLDHAGVGDRVDIRVGRALETLPGLTAEAPFDLFFVDADKESNADYVRWALKLSRPGSVIVVDNVIRGGEVARADHDDPRVQGVRRLNELLAAEPRLDSTAIQTVGVKGYDGFAIALVTE